MTLFDTVLRTHISNSSLLTKHFDIAQALPIEMSFNNR